MRSSSSLEENIRNKKSPESTITVFSGVFFFFYNLRDYMRFTNQPALLSYPLAVIVQPYLS